MIPVAVFLGVERRTQVFKRNLIATAIALALSGPALAQDPELAKIREEIRQLKEAYEIGRAHV